MATLTLFVYGTLQRGQPNNHLLAGQVFLRAATTLPRYRLYTRGAYPCLVDAEATGRSVYGELWEIDEDVLPALDRLEDAPRLFRRAAIAIENAAGPVVGYLYNGNVQAMPDAGDRWPACEHKS